MTKKNNWAVGEAYKSPARPYDHLNMYRWANNRPWWVRPLQALGVIAMSLGLFILMDYALWSIRVVLSL